MNGPASSVRVAFLGNDPWSVPPLRALSEADGLDVVLVVTNPPRPAGRDSAPRPTAVASAARDAELPVVESDGVRAGGGLDALRRAAPDAIAVVAHGELLTGEVLDLPRLGAVNLHFSVLPRWRGAAPVQRAILEGDETTGVTVMLMDEGLDTGPILATAETTIAPDEDAGALGARLAHLGGPLLVEVLHGLDAGTIEPRPQDHVMAVHAPKLGADERTIDWAAPGDAIVRRVRALAPRPGAMTVFRERPLKILRAAAREIGGRMLDAARAAGDVTVGPNGGVLVGAGSWSDVELLEVAPAGRKRMPAADWARGARIRPGERLG